MDKPHPISLIQVFFTKLIVISIPDHVKDPSGKTAHAPENEIAVEKHPEAENQYIATMQTRFNPDGDVADPYIINVECVGFFHASPELPEAEAIRGVTITANSVLFGAIRESVLWTTGRQPYGPLTLGLSVLAAPTEKPKELES